MRTLRAFLILCLASCFCFGQAVVPNRRKNFQPSSAPSYLPFITGQTLGFLRNNYTGSVGFNFTCSANSTCYSLGRWVVSGNSQTHVVALCSSSCAVLGSVTVNCSGATAGAYAYVALGTPIALVSGTTYYILSQELSGGDQFYDNNTTVTTSAMGVGNLSEYASGTLPGSLSGCTGVNNGTASYGPVNLQYTTP